MRYGRIKCCKIIGFDAVFEKKLVILSVKRRKMTLTSRVRILLWDRINRGPVFQQVWHVKEPPLLNAVSARYRSKFAVLSPKL
jgi:hypothetical protein